MCVKRREPWWVNNGAHGTPMAGRLERDRFVAQGVRMPLVILAVLSEQLASRPP
jgi:hypothetical protein